MITDEQRGLIAEFRLEGLPISWAVYWVCRDPLEGRHYLEECRSGPNLHSWDYFRSCECNILTPDMEEVLKELQG